MAEACDVGGCCEFELWCCCPFCLRRLCVKHWKASACPHDDISKTIDKLPPPPLPPPLPQPPSPPLPPSATQPQDALPQEPDRKRFRISQKTSASIAVREPVPEPLAGPLVLAEGKSPPTSSGGKGGWLKCQHPQCELPFETLYKLTGRKQGFGHITVCNMRVCNGCRKKPMSLVPVMSSTPETKAVKKRTWNFLDAEDIGVWMRDTPESLQEAYIHTVSQPMLYVTERWHLALRVANLIDMNIVPNSFAASKIFTSLRLTRQKLGEAVKAWSQAKDKVEVANHVPKTMQIGKYGAGVLTHKQKCDLVAWVRLRESTNVPVFKAEVQGAMSKFIAINTDGARAECSDALYADWRDWVRKNVVDSNFTIKTSKKAKALRQIEANALTRENLAAEQIRLEALLRRHGIGKFDASTGKMTIQEPQRLWCTDEKGYNDDSLSGHTCLVTSGCSNPTSQHAKSVKHISILSCVCADGTAAPPAVVLSGASWHPDWKAIWPLAVCAATPKGSLNGELFVQLIAETFVHHVRVTLSMTGMIAATFL